MPHKFKKVAGMVPGGWQKLLSLGMGFFFNNQDPEEVNFKVYNNGYIIEVKTDEENTEKAREFWEKHVEKELN